MVRKIHICAAKSEAYVLNSGPLVDCPRRSDCYTEGFLLAPGDVINELTGSPHHIAFKQGANQEIDQKMPGSRKP